MAPYGDEVGLGLVKSEALTYDWIYDLLSDRSGGKAEAMLVARADQMLRRLERRDFLARPESSHDGRLPGYLLEHAIALAEHPRAAVWMDYALKSDPDGLSALGRPRRRLGRRDLLRHGLQHHLHHAAGIAANGHRAWMSGSGRSIASCPTSSSTTSRRVGEIMGFGDSYDGSVPAAIRIAPRA